MSFPLMFDAAFPPTHMPDGYSVAAGYLGGNTPADHVWTPEEWAVFKGHKKLPIFIPQIAIHPVAGNETGGQDATEVAGELNKLNVPFTQAIALDMETVVAPTYVDSFRAQLAAEGFPYLWVYGSADTVFGNPPCNGYWVAEFVASGLPFMFNHADVRATQFRAGGVIDSSTVKDWDYRFRLHRW
jgi:hypothetical protein